MSLPTFELPIRRTGAVPQEYVGAEHRFAFPVALFDELNLMAYRESTTPFIILLSAFKALLLRYSEQTDVAISTKRRHCDWEREAEQTWPPNDRVALRTDLSGNPTFLELIARVDRGWKQIENGAGQGSASQETDVVAPNLRDQAHQVPVSFELIAAAHMLAPDDKSKEPYNGSQRFALEVEVSSNKASNIYSGRIAYNANLFDADVIERFSRHFTVLLADGVRHSYKSLTKLQLLDEKEQHKLLKTWNDTAFHLPKNLLIHRLFEQQVEKCPNSIAVVFEGHSYTYAELDQRASTLALHLHSRSLDSGTLVGIYLERSLEMLVALLGVLKAGCGYVPLDPALPPKRLTYMVVDAKVSLLLTQQSLLPGSFDSPVELLCLDRDWAQIEEDNRSASVETSPSRSSEAANLAYVIYTSGSTGRPKGVQISHFAACNFLLSMAERPGMNADDILLAVTTLSFDIALLELFLPLIVGARVVIASRRASKDAWLLRELINKEKITIMQATPATWRLLLEAKWPGAPEMKVLCGGEAFPADLAVQLLGSCESVWNMYGPTETTVWSIIHPLRRPEKRIPIGRPISNTEVYILDGELQPVPIGVPGMLYIGGAGLAQSYLNRPELTAQAFIPHPFVEDKEARIYRTGDVARYRPDGTIECLGRNDHQVKIRGFRIELGEIESVLNNHPDVLQSVVADREKAPGDKVLAAYLVMEGDAKADARALRTFLRQYVPEYMIPAYFVGIAAVPLTPNGKVDRLGLPPLKISSFGTEDEVILPGDEVEIFLGEVWKRLLGVSTISVHDDFFELGGTSLTAVRLFANIEKQYATTFSLTTLLSAPTVAQLAAIVRGETQIDTKSCLVKIRGGTDQTAPPLFLFHGAGGTVLLYYELAKLLDSRMSVYGFQSYGLQTGQLPDRTIEAMATRYVAEIERVQGRGPYQLAGYCMGGTVALEVAQQLRSRGHEVALVAMLETYNWHKQKTASLASNARHFCEKIVFHVLNLSQADGAGRRQFLQEKMDEAWRRVCMSANSWIPSRTQVAPGEAPVQAAFSTAFDIWKSNDAAALLYQPTRFSGEIVHFRPQKEYTKYSSPSMGWESIAEGGVAQCVMQAFPAGMLVKPFVAELARELNRRVVRSQNDSRENGRPCAPVATTGATARAHPETPVLSENRF